MKWIKYKIVINTINTGTNSEPIYEDVLVDKKVGYSEANLAIAQEEAYNGEYSVEEDSNFYEKKPIGIEFGGTGATNAHSARKALGITPDNIGAVPLECGYFQFLTQDALDLFFEEEIHHNSGNGIYAQKTYILDIKANGLDIHPDIWRLDAIYYDGCAHFKATGTHYKSNVIMYLEFDGQEFSPWVYENPPMEFGVEYLTTEKRNGRSVYTYLTTIRCCGNTGAIQYPGGYPFRTAAQEMQQDGRLSSLGEGHVWATETEIYFKANYVVEDVNVQVWYTK